MRFFIVFFMLLIGLEVRAYLCPSEIATNQEAINAHAWLKQYSGVRNLGSCRLEFIVCEPGDSFDEDAPIAEVLLQLEDGREAYVSVDFPKAPEWRFQTYIYSGKRAMHYRKVDRYFEPIEGRTEVWQFEIQTQWGDPTVLKTVEMGIYSTNTQLNQSNGNDSHWFICD